MQIYYSNKNTEKLCTEYRYSKRKLSERVANDLFKLINFIENADTFYSVLNFPSYNFHLLKGKLEGFYSLDIGGRRSNYRLTISFGDVENEIIYNQSKTIKILTVEEVSKHDDYK